MQVRNLRDRLEFENDLALDHDVDALSAQLRLFVRKDDLHLLRDGKPRLTQFVHERILVELLKQSGTELAVYIDGATDDLMRDILCLSREDTLGHSCPESVHCYTFVLFVLFVFK